MEPNKLEEEFRRLLEYTFEELRYRIENGSITREQGETLHAMLQDRSGVSDHNPDELPWRSSSWCGDVSSDSDDAWNSSGCSF